MTALTQQKTLVVAGVMSGTSADGVDVAMCRIAPPLHISGTPRVKLIGYRSFAYGKSLREAILETMEAKETNSAKLARLSWRLGEVYAECAAATALDLKLKPQLVACHGQTVYHQANAAKYLGKPLRCTWQMGEAALIAERMRVPVISDFRPADLAVGGQGAPLVPMLDWCMFRHAMKDRVLLNLGGIANLTFIPAGGTLEQVRAFDTGPANMVIDACMHKLYGQAFDRNGVVAARGAVRPKLLEAALDTPYFSVPPPKSCGREEFGAAFVRRFLAMASARRTPHTDVIATATRLTAVSIYRAYVRFCRPLLLRSRTEMFVAGGGAQNPTLMRMMHDHFENSGVRVARMEEAGMAIEAKEAAAFALLGWLTWHGLPGNVPSATGASRAVVLGKITHV